MDLFRGGLPSAPDNLGFMTSMDNPPQPADIRGGYPDQFGFGASGVYGQEPQSSLENPQNGKMSDTSKSQNNNVHISISAQADRSGAIWKYHDVPVFVIEPNRTLDEDHSVNKHRVVSLWHLNALLRKHFFCEALENEAAATRDGIRMSRKRPATDAVIEDGIHIPVTIRDFQRQVKFAGYKIANNEGDPDENPRRFKGKTSILSLKLQGEINNVPNLWGNEVLKGQNVGFAVRRETLYDSVIRKWDGSQFEESLRHPERGWECLQVVPVIAKQGRVPYGSTAKHIVNGVNLTESVNAHDGDTYEWVTVTWPGNRTVRTKMPCPAHFIPVGTIIRRKGFPSQTDVQEAACSFPAYNMLAAQYEDVDIEIYHAGKRNTWLCA